MAINGNDIIVLSNGTAIAASRSSEINVSCDTIETASPTQGAWRESLANRKSWSVTVSFLILENASVNIRDVLKVGSSYTLIVRDRSNTYSLTGSAICTQCKQTYTRGNIANGSFSFKGTGALT